jgi:hypothetical protein
MNLTALDYIKMILEKVSFDASLFEKELKKALKSLMPIEMKELKAWCYEQFGKLYRQILEKCFGRIRTMKA